MLAIIVAMELSPENCVGSTPRRAFSLAEAIVVLGILAILLSIFVPYIAKVRESDRRVRCAENLRTIHHALSAYADRNGHDYPRIRFDPKQPGFVAFTGADSPDAFSANTQVQPNDVTASLWLVVHAGLVNARAFVCPSTSDTADPSDGATQDKLKASARSNFSSPQNLSYSYSLPFSQSPKYRLNSDMLPADFAVLADQNPGTANGKDVTHPAFNAKPLEMARANSANHDSAGQNVLYADGHVQFQATPYCGFGKGWQRDNIYTALTRSPLPVSTQPTSAPAVAPLAPPNPDLNGFVGRDIGPAWEKDSYLVPAGERSSP